MTKSFNIKELGYVPAKNFNGRWSCSYGTNGMEINKHNYYTKRQALVSVYDIYLDKNYICSFKTKKAAIEFVIKKENKLL